MQWIKTHLSWLLCFLEVALLGLACWYRSSFLLAASSSGLWTAFWRLRYERLLDKEGSLQRKKGKEAGFFLLLPGLALICLSAIQPFYVTENKSGYLELGLVCGCAAGAAVLCTLSLIQNWKHPSILRSTIQHCDFSLLSISLTTVVSQLLWFEEDSWAAMVCLTGCMMGGIILLLGMDLILRSLYGYGSTVESLRYIKAAYKRKQRTVHFAKASKDIFLLLVKLGMSIASQSFFMFSNALFTGSMGIARYFALQMEKKERDGQLRIYRTVGWILSLAGLAYVTYSIRLFFGGTPGNYGQIMALTIAFYTFLEFGIQIADLIRLRKKRDLEAETLRLISFCSILVSFVLTQSALMSSSSPGDHAFTDGLAGVFFGSLVVLVGIAMLFRYLFYRGEFQE